MYTCIYICIYIGRKDAPLGKFQAELLHPPMRFVVPACEEHDLLAADFIRVIFARVVLPMPRHRRGENPDL